MTDFRFKDLADGQVLRHSKTGQQFVKSGDQLLPFTELDLSSKSAHAIGQMIASRDATIRKLRQEVADAKAGGQPASELRDAMMPTLERIKEYLRDSDQPVARRMLDSLIGHLKSIPTLEPPSDKVADKGGLKPYKPLDHGPRDLEAAAPEYRQPPDLSRNTL